MNKFIFSLLFVSLFLTGGCEKTPETIDREIGTNLSYVIDHRTGLCYARSSNGYGYVYSLVPCDKVEKLIKNPITVPKQENKCYKQIGNKLVEIPCPNG
jgi:hypothetical protein